MGQLGAGVILWVCWSWREGYSVDGGLAEVHDIVYSRKIEWASKGQLYNNIVGVHYCWWICHFLVSCVIRIDTRPQKRLIQTITGVRLMTHCNFITREQEVLLSVLWSTPQVSRIIMLMLAQLGRRDIRTKKFQHDNVKKFMRLCNKPLKVAVSSLNQWPVIKLIAIDIDSAFVGSTSVNN